MISLKNIFKRKPGTPKIPVIRLGKTDSTNNYFLSHPQDEHRMMLAVAEHQSAGRGQGGNHWESEEGKNLLFSVLIHPRMVPIRQQFLLSMMGGIALKMVLSKYADHISLKWPNDIYWNDCKISGTLIETTISGGHIENCILGVGLNVNQTQWTSDAPNPISLAQILGAPQDREQLLEEIIKAFSNTYSLIENGHYTDIAALYHDALYRAHGFHSYRDSEGTFEAALVEVEDDGRLILRDREGRIREYFFKEIEFII